MPYGKVQRVDARGFFFLSDDQQPRAAWTFAHVSAMPEAALPSVGDAFSYDVQPGRDGRPRAVDLRPLSAANEEADRVFGRE
ncbi:hypothetical protein [Aquamicrobium defluvii]|uniref:Cold-shock protein n=1 Tax=Aquamicrobium defluvii TaxID=69279 RepID=A0A011UVV9_9HYPH|nr:hypothetical protein [Aquamicrobium defluvii]EXL09978.1 hypothetical protein BG36_17570 [Aquamicrobium defluvii]EZQ16783.1 hypothetical protein CF98_39890 [Halopseudomonas bauzanensis]